MRKHYLDNLRWVTVVLVVIYHVIYMFSVVMEDFTLGPFSGVQYQDVLQYLLYPWFMVILFIAAGMSSRYYLETHTVKEFVRSRTRKLLVPSTVGLLILGGPQGYISMSITNAFANIPDTVPKPVLFFIMVLSGTGVLWFIQLLWLFSMLLAFVRKHEKGRLYELGGKAKLPVLLLTVVPVYLSGLILNMPVVSVYRFGIYGFTFFLGYFLFAHDEIIEKLAAIRIPLMIASVLLGGLYVYLHFGDNYAVAPTVSSPSAVAFGYCMCLTMLGCFKAWYDKTDRVAEFMKKRSFGLYILHYLPVSAAALYLKRYTSMPALPVYLIVAAAGFLGSFLLYELLSRIPFIRWCLFGMKGKKNVS